MATLNIKLDYIKTANYALHHNRIPICKTLNITNSSGCDATNIQVHCTGEYIQEYHSVVIPVVNAGATIRVKDFEIAPLAAKLAQLTERVVSDFMVSVTQDGNTICEQHYDIELMAFDQWTGFEVQPQTLVSFVTPNNPAISTLIVKAANVLKQATGKNVFYAYQTGNPNDVHTQVAAIYEAVQQCNIVYRELPPGFEDCGQRITMPEQVLKSRLANCIEMSVLFASALEAVGINSAIILMKNHAFLAVHLVDESCPYSLCDDHSWIEKRCSEGIDEMIVFECTGANQSTTFDQAVKSASHTLLDHDKFEGLIDVKRCRLEHYLPLPSLVEHNGELVIDENSALVDVSAINTTEHDRYDLTPLQETARELTKYDIWERKLLDFSLRNQLLNLSLRRRAVQFISFAVDRIEDHLQDGEEYCIYERPEMDIHSSDLEQNTLMCSKLQANLCSLVTSDIESHRLHTFLTEGASASVLKNIYRAARNTIEETGANSLFLTIGALRWYETPQSETPRYAPLLLFPVEMVYKKGRYYIRSREEDISFNITLIEFLRQNYDINIQGLNPLPKDDKGVDVKLIFAAVRDAIKEQKRWDVEEECLLGTFSFSKFLMWNDVHNNREHLSKNDIVNSLVANRLTWTPSAITTDLRSIDGTMTPAELAIPVPVDSSQMAAVIEGGMGHSFILYGPPGTGKSQTITNLIANALFHGKRVLFVAEKMAALSVVQSRLAKIGLDAFCLELHSNKASKRHVLEQLNKALHVTHIIAPAEYKETADKIFAERKVLIEYIQSLHDVDKQDGLSLYDCIVRYESISTTPLSDFSANDSLNKTLSSGGIKVIEDLLGSKLETLIKLVGQPSQHPLKGMIVDEQMVMSPNEIVGQMNEAAQYLQQCNNQRDDLNQTRSLRDQLLRDNAPALLEQDARELYDEWRKAKAKWFVPRFFAKRNFVKRMRAYNPYITAESLDSLTNDLLTYSEKHSCIEKMRSYLLRYFGINSKQDEIPDLNVLNEFTSKLNNWVQHAPQMRDWLHWCNYCKELKSAGLDSVVEAMEQKSYTATELRDALLKALFKDKTIEKMRKSPLLSTFEGMIFDERVKAYKQLDTEFQILTQKELYARLASQVPRVTNHIDSSSEIGLLNRNISNGGRGLSLRDLFDQIPTLMPRLCPCMLMSPMSVAQYIDLNAEKFDLVVFDEASQMPTSEAVGAIARGKSLIVVGDPKQMPPTSFFTSTNVDEEEAAIDDMESILEDCRTLEMPSLQLNWHYRSRHESLIAFSNNEYYDGNLITFPSVDDKETKVKYVPINGYYDKGGKRSNKAEAQAIVNEIARRLKDEKLREMSIGVIAFSVVQQSLIEDLLQDLLDKDKALKEFADSMYEPIFVKNLENVQGDERDVILFSIGYGPSKDGKVSMNFGPLNNNGGERRLNVAVSRARYEMQVYSTLKSSMIDLRRSKARGVEGLKHFLEYAESQMLPSSQNCNRQHCNTAVAEQIADGLRKKGYIVNLGVGRSQFKVDIAVSEPTTPDIYKLGILLDGENYRDTQTTCDREIVQPSVLNGLKWRVMRVWSVDWFNNKDRVMNRIVEQLNATPTSKEPNSTAKPAFDLSQEKIEEFHSNAKEYCQFAASTEQALAMSDRNLVTNIVTTEQPILFAVLCKRVASLRGQRVGPNLRKDMQAITNAFFYTQDDINDKVVWMSQGDAANYHNYRCDEVRDITEIPVVEIENVILEGIEEQIALPTNNLTLIAAKKLGFTRRGPNLETTLNQAVERLIQDKKIENVDGKLRLTH